MQTKRTNHQQHNQKQYHRQTANNREVQLDSQAIDPAMPTYSTHTHLQFMVHLRPQQAQLGCVQGSIVDADIMHLADEWIKQVL